MEFPLCVAITILLHEETDADKFVETDIDDENALIRHLVERQGKTELLLCCQ